MSADASSPSVASSSTASSPTPPQQPSRQHKKANKPFLVHQRYLARQAKDKQEAQRRKDAGLPPLPKEVPFLWSVLKWTVLALVTSSFLSRSATGTWNWGYEGKYDSLTKVSSGDCSTSVESVLTVSPSIDLRDLPSHASYLPQRAATRPSRRHRPGVSSLR